MFTVTKLNPKNDLLPLESPSKLSNTENAEEEQEKIFLIQDSTPAIYPEHFDNIIKGINKSSLNENELLFSACYGIGLELGFYNLLDEVPKIPLGTYWGFSYILENVLKYSKNCQYKVEAGGQIYTMKLNLLNTPISKDRGFKLIGIRSGDSLIVTLSHLNHSTRNSFSIFLSTSKYVPLLNVRNVHRCFRELQELSIQLKDRLFGPARNYYFTIRRLPHPSLVGIPSDQLDSILQYLKKQFAFNDRRRYDKFFTIIGIGNLRRT